MQSALFDEPAALPNGLAFVPEFLSLEEEGALLDSILALELHEARYKQYTTRRRIASFGAEYHFDANELKPAPGMPPFLLTLRERVARWLALPTVEPTKALRYSITLRTSVKRP